MAFSLRGAGYAQRQRDIGKDTTPSQTWYEVIHTSACRQRDGEHVEEVTKALTLMRSQRYIVLRCGSKV